MLFGVLVQISYLSMLAIKPYYVYTTSQILIILPRICDFASCQILLYVTLFFVLLVCLCILFFCCFVINHLLHLNPALFSCTNITHCLDHSVLVKLDSTRVFYIREIFMMWPQIRNSQCYLFLFTMSFFWPMSIFGIRTTVTPIGYLHLKLN